MKKKELLTNFSEKIGEHYFELLQFASVINLCRNEIDLSEEMEQRVDELMGQMKKETNAILEEEVEENGR